MDNLCNIPELIIIIYNKLTFRDQLQLVQSNSALRNIFENFIFPIEYPTLKFRIIREAKKIIVSNVKAEDCMVLHYNELEIFLKFEADLVEKLHVEDNTFYFNRDCPSPSFFAQLEVNLPNLTCLQYKTLVLSWNHIDLLAKYCPKLSELQIIDCEFIKNVNNLSASDTGLSVGSLKQIKELKNLVFHPRFCFHIPMRVICDLIAGVPLESLKLRNTCVLGKRITKRCLNNYLKELEIELNSEQIKFFESIGILKNLLRLNLKIDDGDIAEALNIIAKTCENLECFIFNSYSHTYTTKLPCMPPNLKELSLLGSIELTPTNFEDVLTKFKIEKFICANTFTDLKLFKDFRISPYIKILDICHINTYQFPSFYANNKNLIELNWYDFDDSVPDEIQKRECLVTCRNLENLFIQRGFISLSIILKLNHLQKLQISSWVEVSMSYVIGLLKHASLKELHILGDTEFNEATNIPLQGYPTTIKLLNIRFNYFKIGLVFWLDMLQQNPTMTIICSDIPSYLYLKFLEELVHHENLPKDLKKIKLCNFILSCKDLRNNFLSTIEPIEQLVNREYRINLSLLRKPN